MGYFALQEDNTAKALLEAALCNIDLWEEMEDGGEYLISGFVKTQIEEALKLINEGEG